MYTGNRVDALHPFTPFLFESLNQYRLCPHQLAGSPSLLHLLLQPKASKSGSAQAEPLVCNNGSVTAVIKYSIPALMFTYLIFLLLKKGGEVNNKHCESSCHLVRLERLEGVM